MPTNKSATKEFDPTGNYAIVEASGQQFWLQTNRYYDLDRIKAKVDEIVTLDKVLLIKEGKEITLGSPHINEAKVQLKVLGHRRGNKILVYKMRPKKKTRRKNGHRQELTRVIVESITIGGATKSSDNKTSAKKAAPSPKTTTANKSAEEKVAAPSKKASATKKTTSPKKPTS